jgi:hypothetical protein
MPHAYTEDQLVEQSAIGLFAEFGWQTAAAQVSSSLLPLLLPVLMMLLHQHNATATPVLHEHSAAGMPWV